MSQRDNLIKLFEDNGGTLTLGQILGNYALIGSKYTNRISEARDALKEKGYTIKYYGKESPTESIYKVEPLNVVKFENGQGVLCLGQ